MNESKGKLRELFGSARSVDRYFLEEKCPFSQKRKLKTGNIKVVAGISVTLLVFVVLFFGESAERETEQSESTVVQAEDLPSRVTTGNAPTDGGISVGGQWNSGEALSGISLGSGTMSAQNRQYTASQIVRGTEGGRGFGIPMGSTVLVRLMNTLLSSDSSQPVIAELVEDAIWQNSVLIPTGTKVIGSASFDDAAKRLQIRFNTFVYPEGDQHSVSALALLNDGSSGLPGNYHSGTTKKEIGRFLGNFVGGLADGMKERQVGGQGGIAFEPGSLKNGILNGLTVSGMDQAKSFSESMQNVQPFLDVAGGTQFLLYFEREYSP